ncbi:ArsI/CadI family heavy metal resistance metalloenzyme [Lysobacter sp. CFH 32150]|uniref:ArsI/CadI family heavy metal resistance metalloenzyme n=1 Tax=Lysobacter sp. CFH 32150 TaxID=2927128 RepID=UPI001FA72B50|nr:ArsI/CadI family heavy metal resistance metalloenzyme [Lysobacter sp. CFH 32150]MCI4568687.1 VOC family protein [Lysobacter sp. CFH 32150]
MNRFHVHIHVADLDQNIRFYSQLFGAQPIVTKDDYAKWMLDDPRINFAISTGKSDETGIAHLGLQAETPEALAAIGARLQAADAVTLAEAGTTCCYARSDKLWAEDPQGVRWESFHTHGGATTYYADPTGVAVARDTCCGPASVTPSDGNSCAPSCSVAPADQIPAAGKSACCA